MHKKFDANCEYRGLTPVQCDRIRHTWPDLRNVKDITEPIRQTLALYGKRTAV
jgi:hypothetical protein